MGTCVRVDSTHPDYGKPSADLRSPRLATVEGRALWANIMPIEGQHSCG